MNCLICLSDKSGNFFAEIARNTVKSEKTGFGTVVEIVPRPVLRFRVKNPAHLLGQIHGAKQAEKVSGGRSKH